MERVACPNYGQAIPVCVRSRMTVLHAQILFLALKVTVPLYEGRLPPNI